MLRRQSSADVDGFGAALDSTGIAWSSDVTARYKNPAALDTDKYASSKSSAIVEELMKEMSFCSKMAGKI